MVWEVMYYYFFAAKSGIVACLSVLILGLFMLNLSVYYQGIAETPSYNHDVRRVCIQ